MLDMENQNVEQENRRGIEEVFFSGEVWGMARSGEPWNSPPRTTAGSVLDLIDFGRQRRRTGGARQRKEGGAVAAHGREGARRAAAATRVAAACRAGAGGRREKEGLGLEVRSNGEKALHESYTRDKKKLPDHALEMRHSAATVWPMNLKWQFCRLLAQLPESSPIAFI